MITLENVGKSFGARVLLRDVTVTLGPGDRFGIVGPNGAGKSTLLSLLLGHDHPDAGSIRKTRGLTIGHLPQEVMTEPRQTALAAALRPSGRLAEVQEELDTLPDALATAATSGERERLAARLADAHTAYAEIGGHDREARARRVLAGLGFRPGEEERPLATFSGGYAMRAELARLLVDVPDVLLLDEPTNHLDLESVLWLQGILASTPATLVVISHDRAFLNATVRSILEIDRTTLTRYAGNYDDYVREREERRATREAAARAQERRIRQTERFIERFRAKNTKATQVQSRIKALAKEERIVLEREGPRVRIRFPQPERTSEIALALEGVRYAYGKKVVYDGFDFFLRRGERTVLVGPNGAGKSTLLKLLGGVLEPASGTRRPGLRATIGYYGQHRHELLDLGKTVLENAWSAAPDESETFVRTLLGSFLFVGDDVQKSASVLSGGEKSRLALAKILLDPPSVLLLDEPTTHLDIPSLDALIQALREYEGALCFVSHDAHFIREVAQRVVRIESGAVTEYPGDWSYYLWKRGRETAAAVDASELEAATDEMSRSGRGRREERRRAAEARQDLAARTRPLRQELAVVEREVADLEREKAELESRLASPDSYADPAFDAGAEQQRHVALSRRLSERMDRWIELQTLLEGAEGSGASE